MKRFAMVAALLLAFAGALYAGKEFVLPRPANAVTYPAHDQHPQEHVTIAADPYDTAQKAAIFKTNFRDYGYLPVFFVITNDNDQPIALTRIRVELVTANRSKIQPATDEDLARRIARTRRRGDEPQRLPAPFPRRGPDVGLKKDTREEIDAAQFRAMAVEPHATQGGFLFLDVQDIQEPLAGAHIYVTGVRDSNGQELMFFDIPLDNYLSPPKK